MDRSQMPDPPTPCPNCNANAASSSGRNLGRSATRQSADGIATDDAAGWWIYPIWAMMVIAVDAWAGAGGV
jgi:hypothetical protein